MRMNKETKIELDRSYDRLFKLEREQEGLKIGLREVNREIEHECAVISRLKIHGVEK